MEADGVDLTPPRRQHRTLLALLLLHADEVVATDDCVEALWGERPPETAQTALHGHVSALRKRLGPERIETQDPGYLLAAGRRGRGGHPSVRAPCSRAAGRRSPRPVGTAQEGARSLPGRAARPTSATRGSHSQEAARLEELRLVVLRRADSDRSSSSAATRRSFSSSSGSSSNHPLREGLRAQLMLALYRAGRQADALRGFPGRARRAPRRAGARPRPRAAAARAADPETTTPSSQPPMRSHLRGTPRAAEPSRPASSPFC